MLREKNRKKVLATLCDESHVDMAKALFSSAYFKGGWDGDYLLLAHQVPEEKLNWFRNKGIEVWNCQPLSNKYYGNWKPVFLSKLYVFDRKIKKWDNVVYLDADCMVRADIRKLGEVRGFKARKIMIAFGGTEPTLRFTPKNHFNTGVLAFSTGVVKDDTFSSLKSLIPQVVDQVKDKKNLVVVDEIIMSKYFKNIWKNFSLVYHIIPEQVETFCFIDYPKVKGIIFHHIYGFGKYPKPWSPHSYFYTEWKGNLGKIDEVNFNDRVATFESWPLWEMYLYSFYYSFNKLFYPFVNRKVGQTGLLIKKVNPRVYLLLKKFLFNDNEK